MLELKKFLELTDRVFILDSDIGSDIDDAMALLLCLRLKDFPLAAITTVYNCVELRARIARKMLQLEGLNMPVGIGIGVPMDELSFTWQTDREGKGLLDESDLNASLDDLDITEDGIKLMIDTIKQYAGQVEIIAIGQFTNVATAIKRDPEIKNKIKRIWSMSAGITYNLPVPENFPLPNETYFAIQSHNIRMDIIAAMEVLESGIPITFFGNDVTTKVFFNKSDIQRVENQGSRLNKATMIMMKVWLEYRSKLFNQDITRTCLHDALVVAEAWGENFTKRAPIDMTIDRIGSTNLRYNPSSKNEIAWTVEAEKFERWYLDTVDK